MRTLVKTTDAIGMMAMVALMLLVSVDVLGRYLLTRPIRGSMETSQLLMAIMVFFAWAGIQAKRAHVNTDLVVTRFSARGRSALDGLSLFLTLVLFALTAWQAFEVARKDMAMGRLIYVVEWPLAPFHFLLALAAITVCVVLVFQLRHPSGKVDDGS